MTEFRISESTYLAWVNVKPYLSHVKDLPMFFAENAGVLLEGVGNQSGKYLNLQKDRRGYTLQEE
jgi:bifunctional pyridoxal-dependent enzyme with beta-cystathionase and maltose regulon repressor activities